MSYQRKTQICIDEIPAELCTRQEATEILGLNNGSAFTSEKRLMKLPTVHVVYKGNRIVLYNRRMIEALKYKPIPDGYISTKEACQILGRTKESATVYFMRKHGLEPIWIKKHHSGWYWKRKDVENVKQLRKTCAHVKKS